MYFFCFYVPQNHCERVKEAVFAAGAGQVGNYQNCAWQVLGQGQFKPKQGAKPFVGERGELEVLAELRVEMICADENIRDVVEALKQAHPYEEPAYHVLKMADF